MSGFGATNTDLAVETRALGKRYRSLWALQECTVSVPRGRVSALVGPNGAGKTTLLKMLVGLTRPSTGEASVLGRQPGQSEEFLASIGYLAQDVPLYRRLTVADHLDLGAHLNRRWDATAATERLRELRVPLDRPISTFSGGQRAQVALSLALAKRPQVLLLDEPVAALDPLARRQFLASLSEAVSDGDLTVVLSSHLLHDLERVCDHLILLAASRPQLCADIDEILATHRSLSGSRQAMSGVRGDFEVVKGTHTQNQTRLLVRLDGPMIDPAPAVDEVGLEDIVLAYMGRDAESEGMVLNVVGSRR